jgi:pimeloyl-ACP methyl ester carboxylesterase
MPPAQASRSSIVVYRRESSTLHARGMIFFRALLLAFPFLGFVRVAWGADATVWTGENFGGVRHIVETSQGRAFVLLPSSPVPERPFPWVWYAPAIKGYPNAKLNWLFTRLIAAGVGVVGLDVGETYANPDARDRFWAFYQDTRARHRLASKVCLLAQSRGGLNHYNFAADHPDVVRCIAGIYPVMDLRSYPGLAKAAPAYHLSADEFATQLSRHNPVDRLEVLARNFIPILHLHGDRDTLVPLEPNSGVAAERYRAAGGPMTLITVRGRGHEEVAEYFQSDALLQFLLEQARKD